MSDLSPFTLTLLENHPDKAAKVLEALSAQETGKFLETLPLPLAARLLEKMDLSSAAQCLSFMKVQAASRLMEKSRVVTGVSLLRMMPVARIGNLLSHLSEKKTALFHSQLSYPRDLVGAWIDRESPTLMEHFSVKEARNHLRNSGWAANHSLCVLTETGRVSGMIELYRLAVARSKTSLMKITTSIQGTLSDRVPLETVRTLPDWEILDAFPVVGPKEEYLGVLTKNQVIKALSFLQETVSEREGNVSILNIMEGYTAALTGIIHSLLSFSPPRNSTSE